MSSLRHLFRWNGWASFSITHRIAVLRYESAIKELRCPLLRSQESVTPASRSLHVKMIRLVASSMLLARYKWFPLVLALLLLGSQGHAQTDELLPEIDVYYKVNRDIRTSFQTKETREGSTPTSAELGPSLDVYLTRLSNLVKITSFDPDDSKARPLILSIGYRYLPTPGQLPTNRMEPVLTAALPVPKVGILLTDRNRADLDWQNGSFMWRYRNRVQLERSVRIRSYHLSPYASVEPFYESQYRKWSDTALYAGCIFPIRKHSELNLYYEHQNNTGKSPNQQVNQLGLMLGLYF
jgi:hypothetical protein